MVAAVRRGASQRAVARRFGVSLRTVQHWVDRAASQRLDRVDWSDRRQVPHRAPNRTPAWLEDRVLTKRAELKQSILGECGAVMIRETLLAEGIPAPSVRTIGRILARRGAVDRHQRRRRPPPPPGWHLPSVRERTVELELFDFIEMLKLADGPLVDILTGIALHAGAPMAVPLIQATTTSVLDCLRRHWQTHGLPSYAQFDNDTRFQGAHQHRDVFGRVVRLCLQLGITPVFVPPREFGFQNPIETFNGLWQRKVWGRFHFESFSALTDHSTRYLAARKQRLTARIATAPARLPWPEDWQWKPSQLSAGTVIYIRRTSERGSVTFLGHTWLIDPHWRHRLIRAEVDLRQHEIRCFALRRNAPTEQPLLQVLPYDYPKPDLVL
jgi:transposase-like protein